jgi:bacteriophage N4 adsorption protein B
MPVDSVDFIAYLLVSVKLLMVLVSAVFLVSGIDDLFIDICYVLRNLYRRLFVMPRYRPLSEQDLLEFPEQPIAVMIPAWDESAVICPMLQNAVRTLDYHNFHIFVGTYPNDPDTHREVELVREQYANMCNYSISDSRDHVS